MPWEDMNHLDWPHAVSPHGLNLRSYNLQQVPKSLNPPRYWPTLMQKAFDSSLRVSMKWQCGSSSQHLLSGLAYLHFVYRLDQKVHSVLYFRLHSFNARVLVLVRNIFSSTNDFQDHNSKAVDINLHCDIFFLLSTQGPYIPEFPLPSLTHVSDPFRSIWLIQNQKFWH